VQAKVAQMKIDKAELESKHVTLSLTHDNLLAGVNQLSNQLVTTLNIVQSLRLQIEGIPGAIDLTQPPAQDPTQKWDLVNVILS
jgi:hypothetical protein